MDSGSEPECRDQGPAACVEFSRCIQSTQTGKCVSVSEISSDPTNRRVVLTKDAVQAATYRSGLHRIHVSRILFARLDYRAFHRAIRQRPAVSGFVQFGERLALLPDALISEIQNPHWHE